MTPTQSRNTNQSVLPTEQDSKAQPHDWVKNEGKTALIICTELSASKELKLKEPQVRSTPLMLAEASPNPLSKNSTSFLTNSDGKTCSSCRDVKISKRGIYIRISDVQQHSVHKDGSTPGCHSAVVVTPIMARCSSP